MQDVGLGARSCQHRSGAVGYTSYYLVGCIALNSAWTKTCIDRTFICDPESVHEVRPVKSALRSRLKSVSGKV